MEVGALGIVERTMREDVVACVKWTTRDEVRQAVTQLKYYDEHAKKRLDPDLVQKGERKVLGKFKTMSVRARDTPGGRRGSRGEEREGQVA